MIFKKKKLLDLQESCVNRECMPGMYSGSGTCLACHASCKTCDGSKVCNVFGNVLSHITVAHNKARDCTTCYPEHRLYVSTCVSTCPEGSRPSTQVLTWLFLLFRLKPIIIRHTSYIIDIVNLGSLQTHTCLACPHACSSCEGEGRWEIPSSEWSYL